MLKFAKNKGLNLITRKPETQFICEGNGFAVIATEMGIRMSGDSPIIGTAEDMQVLAQILGLAAHEFERIAEEESAKRKAKILAGG